MGMVYRCGGAYDAIQASVTDGVQVHIKVLGLDAPTGSKFPFDASPQSPADPGLACRCEIRRWQEGKETKVAITNSRNGHSTRRIWKPCAKRNAQSTSERSQPLSVSRSIARKYQPTARPRPRDKPRPRGSHLHQCTVNRPQDRPRGRQIAC